VLGRTTPRPCHGVPKKQRGTSHDRYLMNWKGREGKRRSLATVSYWPAFVRRHWATLQLVTSDGEYRAACGSRRRVTALGGFTSTPTRCCAMPLSAAWGTLRFVTSFLTSVNLFLTGHVSFRCWPSPLERLTASCSLTLSREGVSKLPVHEQVDGSCK
jgi:hypothetical protein